MGNLMAKPDKPSGIKRKRGPYVAASRRCGVCGPCTNVRSKRACLDPRQAVERQQTRRQKRYLVRHDRVAPQAELLPHEAAQILTDMQQRGAAEQLAADLEHAKAAEARANKKLAGAREALRFMMHDAEEQQRRATAAEARSNEKLAAAREALRSMMRHTGTALEALAALEALEASDAPAARKKQRRTN